MPHKTAKYLYVSFIVLALVLFGMFFGCVFQTVFGVPCPGCGMTRAWLAVLKGDFGAAFRWHPLFWLVPLLGIFSVLHKRLPSRFVLSASMVFIVLFLGTYIIRLFMYAPHTPPMTLHQNPYFRMAIGQVIKLFQG